MKWYDLAIRLGNRDAIRDLAQMYATGEGGKVDRQKAFLLYVGPIMNGDRQALKEAARLRSQMSETEWVKVQKGLRQQVYGCKTGVCHLDVKKLEAALQEAASQ
jgi:TPR repeat protein